MFGSDKKHTVRAGFFGTVVDSFKDADTAKAAAEKAAKGTGIFGGTTATVEYGGKTTHTEKKSGGWPF